MIHFTIQQLYNFVGPVLGAVCAKVVDHFLKVRRIKIFKKKDPVAESVKNNILIEHKLEEVLHEFEADRVYLLQFHNGGNFYPTGKSIPKFSVFYEKNLPGITSMQERFQNIPVSIFGKFFNYLSENDVSYYYDLKRTPTDELESRGYNRETDAKSTYCASIKTIDDKFMGVLVVHFTKRKRILSEDKIKDIQIHAASIGAALSVHQEDKSK